MTGPVPLYLLKTFVVCGVVCMCLSATPGPDWLSWRGRRLSEGQSRERYRGPHALHHEQTVAVVTYNGPRDTIDRCRLILAESSDQFDKLDLLNHLAARMPVEQVSFQVMMSVVLICQESQQQTGREESQPARGARYNSSNTEPVNYWALARGILPGTLWCGVDDIAENYYSLGPEFELDKCCRAHDHCPLKVKSFKTRYGVFNLGPYTKSHCACDKMFYDCLKRVDTDQSNAVGDFFFNTIGVQCVEKRVRRKCVKRTTVEGKLYEKESEAAEDILEKTFDLGLVFGVENKSSLCLRWEDEPHDLAKFYIVNTKENY